MAAIALKNFSRFKLPLLALMAAALYLPSLKNGYVGWDDALIRSNPAIHSLAPGNVVRMFTSMQGASYQPVRTLAQALVYALDGARPRGYLWLNLMLYLVSIILFYLVVEYLIRTQGNEYWRQRKELAALTAAAAFAFHPVHVEAVSWLQGGKQSLMAVFFLASFYYYLRFRREAKPAFYPLSVLFFLVGLASQPGAIGLPFLLLGYEAFATDGAVERAPGRSRALSRAALRLLPYFAPALILGAYLVFATSVTAGSTAAPPLYERLWAVPVVWGKSLFKLILPVNLCCRYPLSAAEAGSSWVRGAAWGLALAGSGWAFRRAAGGGKLAAAALVWFGATLLPTSGLVATSTLLADRYLFLPSMGFCLGLALVVCRARELFSGAGRTAAAPFIIYPLLIAAIAAGFSAVTLKREFDWRDGKTLWSRVVSVYPRHALGLFNLAEAYWNEGRIDRAAELYREVIRIDPGYGDAYVNSALCLRRLGREAEALPFLMRGLELRPDREEAWLELGITYAGRGQDSAACETFQKVIDKQGKWAWAAYFNRARLHLARGESDSAAADLTRAAGTTSYLVTRDAWLEIGRSLERLGRIDLAVELLELGRKEDSFDAACWRMLGNLQLLAGQDREALESLETASRLDPEDFRTCILIGTASLRLKLEEQAVRAYRRALSLGADKSAELLTSLGLALAGCDSLEAASLSFREALGSLSGRPDSAALAENLLRLSGQLRVE